MEFSSLQFCLSLPFFTFTIAFFIFSVVVLLLSRLHKSRPCCEVCEAYANTTWVEQFDNIVDWHTHLLRQSPTATVHIHVLGMTITANPDNVEYMLKTNFDNFPKGKQFSAILGDLLGHGIFNVDGDRWRFQRKLASLELTAATVRSNAFSVVSDELRHRLLPLLDASTSVDLQDVFRRFTFDTICKISFGIDPKCLDLSLPISEFADAFDTATQLSAGRALAPAPVIWKMKRFFNRGSERVLRQAIELVDDLAGEVIRQRRRQRVFNSNDLLSRFMTSVNDDKYLRDIVVSFLLAGRDTVASALTAFFLLISNHPATEAAILDEISRGAHGEVVSYGELRGMQYVHAALYECMRLYPPVQFDSKFCLDDDVLPDGTFVGRGTRVTYHPYAMGRMEKIWGNDCEEFRPERWLREGVFSPESPFRYPVFQGGVRVCLGKEMAVMEMKAVVVYVLREFEVRIDRRLPKFSPGLTASFAGGLPAQVRRRSRAG